MSMARRTSIARALSAVFGVTLAALAGACADADESVIVRGVIPVDESCLATPGVFLARSVVDVSFDTGVILALEVQNNIPNRGNSSTGLMMDGEIQIESARFTVKSFADDGTEVDLGEFVQPVATTSIPGGGQFGNVFIELAPDQLAGLALSLAPGDTSTVVLDIELTALRAGSTGPGKAGRIDVRPFSFPIVLCAGCLRECVPTMSADAENPVDLCTPEACAAPDVQIGGACGNAQDAVVSPPCCTGEPTECPG